jgi:hypothetical protein
MRFLHPFKPFIEEQVHAGPRLSKQTGIPLVFYGENEAEYGNPIGDTDSAKRDWAYFTAEDQSKIYLGGVSVPDLKLQFGVDQNDLQPYLPADPNRIAENNIEVHYLGYYLKWTPQEVYYYAVENTGFKARPFRTQGSYSKYSGIDDKIDDLHFYTTFIKFGIGRASYDASQEIRNKHITREEGVALVKRFDGEFPDGYFDDVMNYIEMKPEQFHQLCDKFRSPHLWGKDSNGLWKLRHNIWKGGLDD